MSSIQRCALWCLTLSFLMLIPTVGVADSFQIINKYGVWHLDTGTNPPTLTKINVDQVLIDSNISDDDGGDDDGGDDDPGNPDPPPTDADEQVKELTALAKLVFGKSNNGKAEAQALSAVLDQMIELVKSTTMTESQLDDAMKLGVTLMEERLDSEGRISEFYSKAKAIGSGKVSLELASKASKALGLAMGFDSARLTSMVRAAQKLFGDGFTVDNAASVVAKQFKSERDSDMAVDAEAFDIGAILQMIMAIIKLLQQFGIF